MENNNENPLKHDEWSVFTFVWSFNLLSWKNERRKQNETKIDWMYRAGRVINYLEQNRFIGDRFLSFLLAFDWSECRTMIMEVEFMISSKTFNWFHNKLLHNFYFASKLHCFFSFLLVRFLFLGPKTLLFNLHCKCSIKFSLPSRLSDANFMD